MTSDVIHALLPIYDDLDEVTGLYKLVDEAIAVARLTGCVRLTDLESPDGAQLLHGTGISRDEVLGHKHTEGPWCWIIRGVRVFGRGIPVRGAQGLWEIPDSLVEGALTS